VILLTLAACGSSSPKTTATTRAARSTTSAPTTTTSTTASTTTTHATTATTLPTFTGFVGKIFTVTEAELASTYHPGCPVGPGSLRRLRMSYWGFDNQSHAGSMVVSAAVAQPVLTAFAALYRAHFPITKMRTLDNFGGDDQASMAADNTSGFNCRYVAGSSPPRWSAHAYGDAIDINTVENPYVAGGVVSPPAGSAYLDRSNVRPGMTGPGTAVNAAFASIGWLWGGRWASPDYQHFSKDGG
jgi:hypothetical protein